MASPQLVLELSKGFFARNNPLRDVMLAVTNTVHNLITFRSKMRLLKYKFMLAQQQLSTMEEHLSLASDPYRGHKMDRPF
ncbi:MAG: hypothetical protein U0003_05495 [Vampirovibrionales bacterium]